jgi:hypothetical protein
MDTLAGRSGESPIPFFRGVLFGIGFSLPVWALLIGLARRLVH